MAARQLVEPDVRALGDEDELRHPGGIERERLGFIGQAAERRGRDRPVDGGHRPRPTEPQVEGALLLAQDADRDVEPGEQRLELRAEQAAPVLPDVAQLADERRRGMPGGRPQPVEQVDARAAAIGAVRVPERALQRREHGPVGRPVLEDPVVDELAKRSEGRVLVADAGEQQFLEPDDGGFGLVADAREGDPEAVEDGIDPGRVATLLRVERVGQVRPTGRLGRSLDEQVTDLVDEAERPDLAGRHRCTARRSVRVHPGRESADGGKVRDEQVAAEAEQDIDDRIAFARRPAHMECPHRRRMARDPRRRQSADASAGRAATTRSIARRSSSRPDGSNS